MGIEHALLPEQGIVTAGDCVIGADSHTCTYGALGAFSTGVGSTDMAAGMATGMAWFKVPSAIKFNLTGKLPANVQRQGRYPAHSSAMIGVDGALYKSTGVHRRGREEPLHGSTACASANMAIEAGAKNGIFPVDDMTLALLYRTAANASRSYTRRTPTRSTNDGYRYRSLHRLRRRLPVPHLPENTQPDQASCTILSIDQVCHRLAARTAASKTCGRGDSILNGPEGGEGHALHRDPGDARSIYRRVHGAAAT